MLNKFRNVNINFWFFTFCAFIFTLLFSIASPIMISHSYFDDNAFHSVGRVLKHGGVLYKDIFEQKGPIFLFLFYLQELISEKFNVLIFVINGLLNYCILHFTYLYSFSILRNKAKSYFVCAFAIAFYYVLAYTMLIPESFAYTMFIYLIYTINNNTNNKDYYFSKLQYFIIGLFISFMMFSKFSLSFSFIIMYFVTIILLIVNKKFKELLHCIMFGILGILVLCSPVFIYFYSVNYFNGFFNDYLVINYQYYGETNMDTLLSNDFDRQLEFPLSVIQNIFKSFTQFIQLGTEVDIIILKLISIITFVFLFIKKSVLNNVFFILIISLFCGYIYGEYFGKTVSLYYLLPGFAFSIIMFTHVLNQVKLNKLSKVSFLVVVIVLTISFQPKIWLNSSLFRDQRPTQTELHTSFVLKHNKAPKILQITLDEGIYLSTNTKPMSKFFYMPNKFFKYDKLWWNYLELIKSKKPDYVIINPDVLNEEKEVQPILRKILLNLDKNYTRSMLTNRKKLDDRVIRDLWQRK